MKKILLAAISILALAGCERRDQIVSSSVNEGMLSNAGLAGCKVYEGKINFTNVTIVRCPASETVSITEQSGKVVNHTVTVSDETVAKEVETQRRLREQQELVRSALNKLNVDERAALGIK